MIYDQPAPLPIIKLCPELKESINTPVEISRFSVLNPWRGHLRASTMAPIFCLTRELLILSHQQGIQQWSCLIDERFKKLCLRFFKMDFHQLGVPLFYMGSLSVPCRIKLSESIRNNLGNSEYTAFWGSKDLQDWIAKLEQHENESS